MSENTNDSAPVFFVPDVEAEQEEKEYASLAALCATLPTAKKTP